jgi:hypothetical protein
MTTSMETGTASKAGQIGYSEGPVAKAIEQRSAQIPSDWFLWAAAGAIAGSLYFQSIGDHKRSTFVGQWVPTLLILGLYNKIVKVAGSE